MEQNQAPKWQQQVEQMLREKYPGDEGSRFLKRAYELGELARGVEIPTGDTGEIVALILKLASEDLYPLAAAYTAFMLGVAWEKYQNADRA